MKSSSPRSISELLRSGDISKLRSEAAERRELAAQVRSGLSEAEAGHVVSAHIDDAGQLVIGMDSPAWAARVRYSTAELLGKTVRVRTAVPHGGRSGGPQGDKSGGPHGGR
jgi:hypothetical protein